MDLEIMHFQTWKSNENGEGVSKVKICFIFAKNVFYNLLFIENIMFMKQIEYRLNMKAKNFFD